MSEDDIIKTVLVESIKEIHEKEKQELISEFVNKIDAALKTVPYHSVFSYLIKLRKEYEERLPDAMGREKRENDKHPKVVYQLGTDSKEYLELKKSYNELISEFVESYENLREFVLEAPILSEDVYKLRDYLHKIKDYIKLDIEKWESRRK